ncbi:hypothetical protein DENSPDRAFT_560246 [Dentipellis sp. KUC8613]|nr:hypothetical protein DENSPDRAFT_560246 [Dentipellis sp. KUC8613]
MWPRRLVVFVLIAKLVSATCRGLLDSYLLPSRPLRPTALHLSPHHLKLQTALEKRATFPCDLMVSVLDLWRCPPGVSK